MNTSPALSTPRATPTTYNEPQLATDLNLVISVRNLLINAGLAGNVINFFDTHRKIKEAMTKRPEVQRYLLNRYWTLQLMSVSTNSVNERFCLVPNGPVEDWLRLFESTIVPFAVQHRLPKGF